MLQKNRSDYLAQKVVEEYSTDYDSAEFNLATGQTNYNVKVNESDAFSKIVYAHSVVIRTNKTITVRFNSASNSAITINISEGSYTIDRKMGLEITNIYITNASGATAAIKVLLIP